MVVAWSFRAALLVALGGAIGSVARYAAGVALTRGDFPWGTVAVNLGGSFLIGLLMFGGLAGGSLGPDARVLLVTGVLGGFTTMSSFAYESVAFLEDGESWRAAAYATMNVGGSLGAALLGRVAALLLP